MTTTRFTKEQLLKRLEEQMSSARYALGFVQDSEILRDIEMDLRLAEIALASLTAEPVLYAAEETLAYANMGELHLTCLSEPMGDAVIPLYAAPPAPVSVPDENGLLPCPCCGGKADFDYDDDNLNWISCSVCGIATDTAYHTDVDARDKLREVWNSRAAMLQDSQPVSNRDELPVIGWLRSDYNSDDKRDPNAPLFMLGSNDPSEAWGVKYIPLSGNSPVIPDGWVMVPVDMTPEQMRAVQIKSELGSYAAANLSGAYSLFREFWDVSVAAAPQQEAE